MNAEILIVDDSPVMRELCLRQVEKLGYTAVTVCNGLEALAAWQSADFSLILMDVQMPEMDGLQATREIREREAALGRHIPIVALTGFSDRATCLAAGMDEFMAKPLSLKQLSETLQSYLPAKALSQAIGGWSPPSR
jgi:two-component system, sensor histidine kinase and response regulator